MADRSREPEDRPKPDDPPKPPDRRWWESWAALTTAIATVVLALVGVLTLASSSSTPAPKSPNPSIIPPIASESPVCAAGSLQLIGSTAFMPIAQDAANAYKQDCPGIKINITVTGGDSAYGLSQVEYAVTHHSSSAGSMIAMYDGLSSDSAGLRPYPMGVVIYALVEHTGLPPNFNITVSTLREIFANGKKGYKGYVAVGRRAGSGSRLTFITKVLNLNPNSQDIMPDKGNNCPKPTESNVNFTNCSEDSTQDLLKFVNGTPNAIGYAELLQANVGAYQQVSVLSIGNVEPTPGNVRNGEYRFWTVEHLYAAMQSTTLTKDFLNFLPQYIEYMESNPPPYFIPCSGMAKRLVAAAC